MRRLLLILLQVSTLALVACGESQPPPPPPTPKGEVTVTLEAPANEARLRADTAVELRGRAVDTVHGALSGGALTWTSSLQGGLGSGSPLSVTLQAGSHELTLAAANPEGTRGSARVRVLVEEPVPNRPPVVSILSPEEGASFDEAGPILLSGAASDPEEGALAGLALTWTSDAVGVLGTGASLRLATLPLGPQTLTLTAVDAGGLTGRASVRVTVYEPGQNRPPVVRILAPAQGEAFALGASVTLRGEATDPEDGPQSPPGLSWASDKDGVLGTGAQLPVSSLSVNVHRLTLTATDSRGLTSQAQVSITVNGSVGVPPVVTIASPASGATFEVGTAVRLSGSARDSGGAVLPDAALAWSSDRQGALGTGGTLTVSTLGVGRHVLRLTATDGQGRVGLAEVTVTLTAVNQPPAVSIQAPAAGTSVVAGTAVTFRGTALDAEDGALGGAALVWTSDRDGALGTGSPLTTASLSSGAHRITLRATDRHGASGSASLTLTVTGVVENRLPQALLSGPSQGVTGAELTFDGGGSSDPDGTLATYAFQFGDGSAEQSGAASTALHTYAKPGAYTVTLTVTDDRGGSARATLRVEVAQAPRLAVVVDPEAAGPHCSLALDAQGLPHVTYLSTGHSQLRHAWFDGTGWRREVVDGPGFQRGEAAGARSSLVLDGQGQARVAYETAAGTVRFASRTASGWSHDASPLGTGAWPWLALDASQGGQPVVLYEASDATGRSLRYARRGVSGSWSAAEVPLSVSTASCRYASALVGGDLLLDASGVARAVASVHCVDERASGATDYPYQGGLAYLERGTGGTWTTRYVVGTGASTPVRSLAGLVSARPRLARSPAGALGILGVGSAWSPVAGQFVPVDGLHHQAPGASTWTRSFVDPQLQTYALGWVGEKPALVTYHGGGLELLTADPENFWQIDVTGLGSSDGVGTTDLRVDPEGKARVCFVRSGRVLVY